jgi:glycerol-3-phosphate dehydrogenase subunit C
MGEHPNAPNGAADWIASDCQLAGHHIEQGMTNMKNIEDTKLAHPITLLRMAYGLPE